MKNIRKKEKKSIGHSVIYETMGQEMDFSGLKTRGRDSSMQFNQAVRIDGKVISDTSDVFIIAEAGVNHNGDMVIARELIDAAAEAGADAVKFQTFRTEGLILKNTEKAPYQKITTDSRETQYDMLKRLELSENQNMELMDYCRKKKITFLSTPFERESLEQLDRLGVAAFKVAATDITNIQFLRQIAEKKKPMIVSAGMCYLEEARCAMEAVAPINQDVIILQCVANYPIQDYEANIRVVRTLKEAFHMLVGYSDHSQGVGASPYAVALGAKVIEKHFTLDKDMEGPDHKASVTPKELKQLISDVRTVEKYLGNGVKIPSCSEQMTRKSLQKYLVASREIAAGEPFSEENIVAKRTNGKGIAALYFNDVIGRAAGKAYSPDEIIELNV